VGSAALLAASAVLARRSTSGGRWLILAAAIATLPVTGAMVPRATPTKASADGLHPLMGLLAAPFLLMLNRKSDEDLDEDLDDSESDASSRVPATRGRAAASDVTLHTVAAESSPELLTALADQPPPAAVPSDGLTGAPRLTPSEVAFRVQHACPMPATTRARLEAAGSFGPPLPPLADASTSVELQQQSPGPHAQPSPSSAAAPLAKVKERGRVVAVFKRGEQIGWWILPDEPEQRKQPFAARPREPRLSPPRVAHVEVRAAAVDSDESDVEPLFGRFDDHHHHYYEDDDEGSSASEGSTDGPAERPSPPPAQPQLPLPPGVQIPPGLGLERHLISAEAVPSAHSASPPVSPTAPSIVPPLPIAPPPPLPPPPPIVLPAPPPDMLPTIAPPRVVTLPLLLPPRVVTPRHTALLQCMRAPLTPTDVVPRRTARTVTFAEGRKRRAAAAELLGTARRSIWLAMSFVYELRRRAQHRSTVLLRATLAAHPLCARFVTKLRFLAARSEQGRRLIGSKPRPIQRDVGYDASTGRFAYRSSTGAMSDVHPAARCPDATIAAYTPEGRVTVPMWPPSSSPIALVPEQSGAWCYYDTERGIPSWFPPAGSTPLASHDLNEYCSEPEVFDRSPPSLDDEIALGSLDKTPWVALFDDAVNCVQLVNRLTGAVRNAPWISLRTDFGCVYFANLVTRQTRWFPPRRWMEGWVSRPHSNSTGRSDLPTGSPLCRTMCCPSYSRGMLPVSAARLRVDGGSPYLDGQGQPPWYGPQLPV